jgi:hypothetical protein
MSASTADVERLFNKLKAMASYSLAANPNCTMQQARDAVVPAKPFTATTRAVFEIVFARAFEQAKSDQADGKSVEGAVYEVYYDGLNALHQLAAAQIDKGAQTVDESLNFLKNETAHLKNPLFSAHYASAFEMELAKKKSGQGERGVAILHRCGAIGRASFCGVASCRTCHGEAPAEN